jgi:hypothetical protein
MRAMDGRHRSCAVTRPCTMPSIAAAVGSKARMFEHRDVRVRASPLGARSTGKFRQHELPKPSCRVHGFGYFRRNESSSLAASETHAKAPRSRERFRVLRIRNRGEDDIPSPLTRPSPSFMKAMDGALRSRATVTTGCSAASVPRPRSRTTCPAPRRCPPGCRAYRCVRLPRPDGRAWTAAARRDWRWTT